ncbi:uncharacterized protein LOC126791711 [Argentina anserina]|uniref:uncharacterized protein LOC126791711 n=1 Tax=Argentina anserina TaxID=57926 RepID=UPI0021764B89|nr:uncharacterized protein LOC126791711 [Potentilla anserina]XP_050374131.1 uncharacterized protein LOC126791711 [Potentilla anserina]XP_050374132.1 uncharacterized protein LOC126791711 [Potentilla anserina]
MDSVEGNNHGDCTEDDSADRSFSPEASDRNGVDGDPEILPRVGEEYQVELSPLMAVSDYLCCLENQTDAESTDSSSYRFLVGLPIPVMWISEEVMCEKDEPCAGYKNAVVMTHKNESLKSEYGSNLVASERNSSKCKAEPMDIDSHQGISFNESAKFNVKQDMIMPENQNGCPVPGTSSISWSHIEEASFLLGLYIFGKDLVLVMKFVGTKQMGDVLSFYYGTFYGSKSYSRWSECKKMRSRKCVFGQRIFTGFRHHELLSRLHPHVSEECQSTLLEVSKTFGEGKILLEEYVFILKSKVGLDALVEAVAIGKGRKDLTGISMETPKSNQVVSRREIPVGKACSALSPLEIVGFLTGNFRLSKARSNDLFWEAVWPRLLARGWHSEQPRQDRFATASKNSLVFLLPGIKKFSRRKLVKGSHYFDSVSDVLSKVASDPELLELETGADKGSTSKDENGWANDTKPEQRHCYLKPRTPTRGTDTMMKFTVVDTSLAYGKTCKVRELRRLPVELNTSISISSSDSENGDDASDELPEISNSVDTSCSHRNEVNVSKNVNTSLGRKEIRDVKYTDYDASEWGHQDFGRHETNVDKKLRKEQIIDICDYMVPRREMKFERSQKVVHKNKNGKVPVSKKRQQLATCSSKKSSSSSSHISPGPMLQQEACNFGHNSEVGEKNHSAVEPSPGRLSSNITTSRGGSPVISSEAVPSSNNVSAGKPHHWPQFDLNEEPSCLDDESDEPMMERQHDGTTQEPGCLKSVETSECMAAFEQQPAGNTRRQSTRNRPLTAKVLEAFACGFLDTKQTRKSRDEFPREKSKSRRSHARVRVPDSFDTSVVDCNMQETSTAVYSNNADGYSELDMVSQLG